MGGCILEALWSLYFGARVGVYVCMSVCVYGLFEGLMGLILVNSRGFALWSYIFRKSEEPNPREFMRVCALELYFSKALLACWLAGWLACWLARWLEGC